MTWNITTDSVIELGWYRISNSIRYRYTTSQVPKFRLWRIKSLQCNWERYLLPLRVGRNFPWVGESTECIWIWHYRLHYLFVSVCACHTCLIKATCLLAFTRLKPKTATVGMSVRRILLLNGSKVRNSGPIFSVCGPKFTKFAFTPFSNWWHLVQIWRYLQ